MEIKAAPIDKGEMNKGATILFLLVVLLFLAGCKEGGGGALPTGLASGKLIIPPDNAVESEPNDTVDQAQPILDAASVSGAASETDRGLIVFVDGKPVEVEDLYRVSATGKIRITLGIAANQIDGNDLDLFLMDAAGNYLDSSEGFVSTELIETPGAGIFLIGVRAFKGSSAYLLDVTPLGSLVNRQTEIFPPGAEFVPGDIILKLKEDSTGARQKVSDVAAQYRLAHRESFPEEIELMRVSLPSQALLKAAGDPASKSNLVKSGENALKALTLDTIQRLRRDPDVAYAEANFIRRPSAVPGDEHYPLQWHYSMINLPQAWDISQGSGDVIVAVVDSGALFDHPDLAPRLIPGFDFISDPANSGDAENGIDADATDVGDDPGRQSSSFHGTHVAGTIGAATNNTAGVAGVTWQTQIMPLRVCGRVGCFDTDIAQAIRYAAGLVNNSRLLPAQRANIINLSLGGPGVSQTQQNAIRAARNAGVIIVAASGNENVGTFNSPAALEGVISVAAVDINSKKAPYSNYGPNVDVTAPGGNAAADLNGDGFPDGILSTWGDDRGQRGFRYMQGTSMAAPHVAGVLALMLAVNPLLTPADIDALLAGTHPATTIRITRDLGGVGRDDLYGHGLIDASQAIIAAKAIPGGTGGAAPSGSILAVSTPAVSFGNFIDTLPIDLTNAGIGTLTITNVTEGASWLTVTPASGTAPLTVSATVDRTGLAEGDYAAAIQIVSDSAQNPTTAIEVKMRVGGTTSGNVGTVFVLVIDKDSFETVRETAATVGEGYSFSISAIPPGTYLVVAGTDRDDDRLICDIEDACGFYPERITIGAKQEIPNIDFIVEELVSPQSITSEGSRLRGKKFKRLP